MVDATRVLHQVSAYAALALAVLLIVATRQAWRRTGWPRAAWIAGSVLVVAALGYGILRGPELAWDQLALWAVVPAEEADLAGVWLPSTAKFVIVDGSELTPSDFETAAWIHTVVLALVVAAALTTLLLSARTRAPDPTGSESPRARV